MRKMIFLSFILTSFLACGTWARSVNDGGSVGNGGDPLGLEFLQNANRVIADVLAESEKRAYPELAPENIQKHLRDTLAKTKVIVTEETLSVTIDGREQIVTAINYPSSITVVLNRTRWISMGDRQKKLSLAFHEMLGLIGLEKSGDYSISKRYVLKEFESSEVIIDPTPFFLIPAKAVSCYQMITTPPNEMPLPDIEDNHFRIPKLYFFKSGGAKDLVINAIRITYALPALNGSQASVGQCMVAGDQLRSLSKRWTHNSSGEAVIPASSSSYSIFETDCALYCGGIKSRSSNEGFATTADVDVFALERDPKTGDETPVRMNRTIKIQGF